MRWSRIAPGCIAFIAAMALLTFGGRIAAPLDNARAQGETPRQQIGDLSTRVAVLESTVAALSTRVAAIDASAGDATQPAAAEQPAATDASQANAAPASGGNDRDRPIPIGQAAAVGDWTVQVTGVTPNASKQIEAENMFNDPPPDGKQFYIISLALTYNGGETGSVYDLDFKAVDANNVAYTTYDPSCGVIPQEFNFGADVFPGGTISGNICVVVDSSTTKTLVLYAQPSFSLGADDRVWFSVQRR